MRVFLTGATGFIGSALVQELTRAGHQVVGLARSEASAKQLVAAGANIHRGSLEDLESLRRGAETADGVIHAAFIHDFTQYAAAGETDRRAVEALGEVLVGSNRPLVITSGTTVVRMGKLATEEDAADPRSVSAVRLPSEEAVMSLASRGVRSSVVRLPPSVHGNGDKAFIPALIALAKEKGVSAYVGDGSNLWPAVHRLDAVRLFRLALEKAPAGSRLHGVAEEGIPVLDIAAVIGKHLGVPVVSKSKEEVADHFGWLSFVIAADNWASSALTRERLGWQPVQPGLLDDLEGGHYFGN
jgi:nucleoside-diphosphate-sugar epimerase